MMVVERVGGVVENGVLRGVVVWLLLLVLKELVFGRVGG